MHRKAKKKKNQSKAETLENVTEAKSEPLKTT